MDGLGERVAGRDVRLVPRVVVKQEAEGPVAEVGVGGRVEDELVPQRASTRREGMPITAAERQAQQMNHSRRPRSTRAHDSSSRSRRARIRCSIWGGNW